MNITSNSDLDDLTGAVDLGWQKVHRWGKRSIRGWGDFCVGDSGVDAERMPSGATLDGRCATIATSFFITTLTGNAGAPPYQITSSVRDF
jgi:hypothetical protein